MEIFRREKDLFNNRAIILTLKLRGVTNYFISLALHATLDALLLTSK